MKTKHGLLKLTLVLLLSAGGLGLRAQVGGLTQTGDMTVCLNATEIYGVIPTAGSTYTWSILAGSGGAGTITNGAAPNNLISVNWISAGVCTLQVIETNALCSGIPVNIQIDVLPALVSGIASADQTIAYNGIPAPISSTVPTGGNSIYTYQWEYSVDGGTTWVAIAGANSLTYAPGALTQTTRYHLVQTSGSGCGTVTTNNVTINVQSLLVPGTAAADQTICYNAAPEPITSTAPTGGDGSYTYQWESSVDGGITWVTEAGATSLSYAPGALTQTTLYRLNQTAGGGSGSATTNSITITVLQQVITSPIWHN